jgi:DNA modification methylase
MILIPLDSILIKEKRWRKAFSDETISSYSDSIRRLGLFHAILVENDGKTLIAGESRLHAILRLNEDGLSFTYGGEEIPLGFVPAIIMGELSNLELKEVEFAENEIRRDLTWQERCIATEQLHEMRKEEAKDRDESYFMKQTAEEIYPSRPSNTKITDVREDLKVAAFSNDVEVMAAPDRKSALAIIEKKRKKAHNERLAKEFEVIRLNTAHSLIEGEPLSVLKKLPNNSFDCIIMDYERIDNMDKSPFHDFMTEAWRVSKLKSHLYIFCKFEDFRTIRSLLYKKEWDVWETPLIWYKGDFAGASPNPLLGPRRCYETIAYAIKNDRNINGAYSDVLFHRFDPEEKFDSIRPKTLYDDILKRTCKVGGKVLEIYCDAGQIFTSAEFSNCIATGIEDDPGKVEMCKYRLKEMER